MIYGQSEFEEKGGPEQWKNISILSIIMKCHGCYNDARIPSTAVKNCPRHQGTPRAFECSSGATSKQVLHTIIRLIDELDKE